MKFLLLSLISFYRRWISPIMAPRCRFYPTCSCYAQEAISEYGSVTGGYLAIKRLLKCHPFHPGGIDLVPEDYSLNLKKPFKTSK